MDLTGFYNMDCMEGMREIPDKYFDLAIVDPPYGIGVNKMTLGNGKRKIFRGQNDWDNKPLDNKYFKELMRISKNQIIWGANHLSVICLLTVVVGYFGTKEQAAMILLMVNLLGLHSIIR